MEDDNFVFNPTLFQKPDYKLVNPSSYPFCEDVSKYEKIAKIGQGTFGEVFKARHRKTHKLVALKKVLMRNNGKEGFPITTLREIKILQNLKHENIISLLQVCRSNEFIDKKATIYLVFEFCEHDLFGILNNLNIEFSLPEIKGLMKQLLKGLHFIHRNKILHRDLKTANILVNKNGILKLADFGLGRIINEDLESKIYTNRVITLWYRPPELLLGETNYGPAIDLWAAGCVMAEFWTRQALLRGSTEQDQLKLITELCGSLTSDQWPGIEKLNFYNKFELPKNYKRGVKKFFKTYVEEYYALDLLDKFFIVDPSERIDAEDALLHSFFWSDPMPESFEKTISCHTNSMYEYQSEETQNSMSQIQSYPQSFQHKDSSKENADDGQLFDLVF